MNLRHERIAMKSYSKNKPNEVVNKNFTISLYLHASIPNTSSLLVNWRENICKTKFINHKFFKR